MNEDDIVSIDAVIDRIKIAGYIDCDEHGRYMEDYEYENIMYYLEKCKDLQSKINKVIELCKNEKKYFYDYAGRDEKTGKLLKRNKIEIDFVNKSKILDILKEGEQN